jgi:Phospholipase_D-nuclease N-terminal
VQSRIDRSGAIVALVDAGLFLAILVPLVLVQITLIVLAVRDLLRPERRVRGGNKGLWAVVIVFGELIGPLVYFAVGRENE